MANITNLFLNQDKRYAEAVVVTLPAILNEGGGRANTAPTYLQGGEAMNASVVEADTIMKKAYLVVDEVYPAGALVGVTVGGVAVFTDAPGDATGITASATEDELFVAKGDVVITVTGLTGDITTGKARVVLDVVHPSLNNGQYAN